MRSGKRRSAVQPSARDYRRRDPTARLLWDLARPTPDPEKVVAGLRAGADLERAAFAAIAHRVGPLAWRVLGSAEARGSLGRAHDHLQREADFRRAQAIMLLPFAVENITDALVSAGLEPLFYKGVALAERYGDPGLRPMDDIDVILPRHDHLAARTALLGHGWKVVTSHASAYDTMFVHPRLPDLPLELHWDLSTWSDRTTRLRGRALWDRRRPIECFGVATYGLAAEDELPALAAHAAKPFHQFRRLMWSVDAAVVVSSAGASLDWRMVEERAREARSRTAVTVALRHAARLGVTAPDRLLDLPLGIARRSALAPLLDERWPLQPEGTQHRQLRYALSDSWTRRAALLVGEITGDGLRNAPRSALVLAVAAARRWLGLLQRPAP